MVQVNGLNKYEIRDPRFKFHKIRRTDTLKRKESNQEHLEIKSPKKYCNAYFLVWNCERVFKMCIKIMTTGKNKKKFAL